MQTHSLKKRYIFKLVTNIMVVPLNLLVISILARSLGPELYGQYRYLIYFFTLLSSFLGFGGNFFTSELAKNNFDKMLISFYQVYMLINWMVASLILSIVIGLNIADLFFPEVVKSQYLWLAFLLAFITFVSQMFESMTDACGLTKKASIFNFLSKLAGLLLLVILIYLIKWVDLYTVFIGSIVAVLITTLAFGSILRSNNIAVIQYRINWTDFKEKFKSFFSYSHPLLTLSIVTFAVGFFTRWVLQFFGGSVEQGYFSFSDAFSGFIIIFSNSVTPLLQREFSISYNIQNLEKIRDLFERSLLIFIAFTTYFCVYLAFNASAFTILIGGNSFEAAVLPTQIMLFYPIPYIANNILYATVYATSKTRLLRNVQISICILNLVITYFLLAPNKYWGFNLGAFGFAIAMVSVTYLNHIILLIYCTRLFNLSWIKMIVRYAKLIISFVVIGTISFVLGKAVAGNLILNIFISGTAYTLSTALLLFRFPSIIGFTRIDVQRFVKVIINGIKNYRISN